MRDPHDYTIEVCIECGAELGRSGNGRCPVDRAHWSRGGIVVRVAARPVAEQDDEVTRRYMSVIPAHASQRSGHLRAALRSFVLNLGSPSYRADPKGNQALLEDALRRACEAIGPNESLGSGEEQS